MSHIKLVVSDIDGTVINSSHQLTSITIDTVKQLAKIQTKMVLATARPPRAVLPIQKELGLSSPMVCYNGAFITEYSPVTKQFQSLHSVPIEFDVAASLARELTAQFSDVSLNIFSNAEWYSLEKNEWSDIEAEITGTPYETILFGELFDDTHPIHKLLCIATKEQIDEVELFITEKAIQGISCVRSKENYLEITSEEVSKKSAMLFLAEEMKLSMEDILSIGDHFNDVPMLEAAGLGIAMGNAPQEVKDAADFVTSTNDENGLAHALKKWVL